MQSLSLRLLRLRTNFINFKPKFLQFQQSKDLKKLPKSLSVLSTSSYSTTVPIDDDIFGFTDDQKQVSKLIPVMIEYLLTTVLRT